MLLQRAPDLIQYRRIIDSRRHLPGLVVGDLPDGAAQNLARARLRQPPRRAVIPPAHSAERANLTKHKGQPRKRDRRHR